MKKQGSIVLTNKVNQKRKGTIFNVKDKSANFRLIKPANEQDFKRDKEGTQESMRSYNPLGAERE